MATYYGRQAYEGFAKALGSKMGLSVTVEAGQSAAINGQGVITLPDMDRYQTQSEFELTCGTIVHELSHQFYGSHEHFANSKNDRFFRDCLNAVLDVADETWIDRWFVTTWQNARPGDLLHKGNWDAKWNKDWKPKNDGNDAWRILCFGIVAAREGIKGRHGTRASIIDFANSKGVDALKCWGLIARAKARKQKSYWDSARSPEWWKRILSLADELAKELAPLAPPPGAPSLPMPGGMGVGTAVGQGQASLPSGATEATAADVAAALDGKPSPQQSQPAQSQAQAQGQPTKGAGGVSAGQAAQYMSHKDACAMLLPAVRKVGERLATDGDCLDTLDGLATGTRIGDVVRLTTDGQCMARWNIDEHADGMAVAVTLDCSGSMRYILPAVSGVAQAFAAGLSDCADIQRIVFGLAAYPVDSFEHCSDLGCTATHYAVEQAVNLLKPKAAGQKWIVIITDGDPDNPAATQRAVQEAIAAGIKVLAIGLGKGTAKMIRGSMPGAKVVAADDVIRLAIELDAAAQEIAR